MVTPSRELEQRRRTVRVLELLDQSHAAYIRGDLAACDRALIDAIATDLDAMAVIEGGMRIGEIPNPDADAWAEYLADARDALAEAELAEGGTGGLQTGP
jgi:hypothetical protein